MKINNFRGDLADNSAKNEALVCDASGYSGVGLYFSDLTATSEFSTVFEKATSALLLYPTWN